MTLSTWLVYVAAVLALTVTPGPMVLSALGLGAALAASESLFTALKWLGAICLAYLGIASLFSSASEIAIHGSVQSFELLRLTLYALSASKAKRWLQQPRRAKLFNRATGVVFLFAAGVLASSRRASAT